MHKKIDIVTFNANEENAVESLFDDLVAGSGSWRRQGPARLKSAPSGRYVLEHTPLGAQGNVVASTAIAAAYVRKRMPDFFVFYGCAGAVDPHDLNSAFLIDAALYVSLGTVRKHSSGNEHVTLKNRWIAPVTVTAPPPLPPAQFSLAGYGIDNLSTLTGIPRAHAATTDKVIKIAPGAPPVPMSRGFGANTYAPSDWSYGQALAHARDLARAASAPLIVDMESYGIGRVGTALKIVDRIVVLRITTDKLVDHEESDSRQAASLMSGRGALALVLLSLLQPTSAHLAKRAVP